MRAMVLDAPGQALREADLPVPDPGPTEVLRARAGLRRVSHRPARPRRRAAAARSSRSSSGTRSSAPWSTRATRSSSVRPGDRVGVPWLGWTCGRCRFCLRGAENLCPQARFTGYQRDGGYAEYAVADARFVFPLPPSARRRRAPRRSCAPG